ncbi:MAG: Rieske 2Fe-2S domain-containing protein [Fimbriiglobus sp.]|jgi:nitrite reductase (NADH) small subunit/3-phenylpropionate/trans-cinnamate dioxygenase ferredoxin subunit|nr:Rieske 2Fe-2S domain-containing protein [Fimbriiglobus sp.]
MAVSILVGKPTDIPVGESVVVSVGKRAIAVFHTPDGFFAIDDCCPHAGASLAGGHVEGGVVSCPWHAWRFRLSDGAWADNPKVKTACFPVTVSETEVRIEVPD